VAELAGRAALVTGGASGIGEAIAALMLERGADVAVLDVDAGGPAGALGLAADVTDTTAVDAAVGEAVDRFGRLDILVNNAGTGARGRIEDNDIDEWRRVLDVNLLGMVRVTRAALPHLRASSGVVVNTASVAADVGLPDRVLYSASKGAVVAASRAMAADLVADGVRVCWVSPGTADTPWVGRLLQAAEDPSAERAALEARQPHGRLVTAREVAEAVCYLASPHGGSTTGVGVTVDGGLTGLRLRR
jgi:NAD(P)-dependent dehydrogenase (short-subunit alcohol dehydrogenase family)